MTEFARALAEKEFMILARLDPPAGPDPAPWQETAASLAGRVDAALVSDNRGAVTRMAAVTAAWLLQQAGVPPVVVFSCRDRNRLALAAELWAAQALGLRDFLLVSGDYVTLGDQPEAKPVYDLDSVQALDLARNLDGGSDLFTGAAASPTASPWPPQAMKLRKKISAGARFLVTTPVHTAAELAPLVAALTLAGGRPLVPVLAGWEPGAEDDPAAAGAAARELGQAGAAGLVLSLSGEAGEWNALLTALGR
ncbi:MAG: methylenetetrahydrofolate reductase [Deltaproteobacteria bacterium]|nr:methylenetetrahydrofolate reductase [Deltaproteobacteria bacterium]